MVVGPVFMKSAIRNTSGVRSSSMPLRMLRELVRAIHSMLTLGYWSWSTQQPAACDSLLFISAGAPLSLHHIFPCNSLSLGCNWMNVTELEIWVSLLSSWLLDALMVFAGMPKWVSQTVAKSLGCSRVNMIEIKIWVSLLNSWLWCTHGIWLFAGMRK